MIRLAAALFLLPLPFLLVGCPARSHPLNQPQAIIADGALRHDKSGMTFPIAVGEFQRRVLQRYDQDGLDVSVGYNLYDSRRQIVVTVYVYPVPPLVSIGSPSETVTSARMLLTRNEFEARKREIMQPRLGARLIEDTETSIPNRSLYRDIEGKPYGTAEISQTE